MRSFFFARASIGIRQAMEAEGECNSTYLASKSFFANPVAISSTSSIYLFPMKIPSLCEFAYLPWKSEARSSRAVGPIAFSEHISGRHLVRHSCCALTNEVTLETDLRDGESPLRG